MPQKSKSSRSTDNGSSIINKIIIGSVIGSALFFIFVSLISFLALRTDAISQTAYMPSGLFAGALSSFVGGFITVSPIKKNGALSGALSGLLQALLCSAVMFFINGNKSGIGTLIFMAVSVALGAVGGISAVNMKIKKKYR